MTLEYLEMQDQDSSWRCQSGSWGYCFVGEVFCSCNGHEALLDGISWNPSIDPALQWAFNRAHNLEAEVRSNSNSPKRVSKEPDACINVEQSS